MNLSKLVEKGLVKQTEAGYEAVSANAVEIIKAVVELDGNQLMDDAGNPVDVSQISLSSMQEEAPKEELQKTIDTAVEAAVSKMAVQTPRANFHVEVGPRRIYGKSSVFPCDPERSGAEKAHLFGAWVYSQASGSGVNESVKAKAKQILKDRGFKGITTGTDPWVVAEQFLGNIVDLKVNPSVYLSVAQNVPLNASGQGKGYYSRYNSSLTSNQVEGSTRSVVDLDLVGVSMQAFNEGGFTKFSNEVDADALGLVGETVMRELARTTNRNIDRKAFAVDTNEGVVGLGAALAAAGSASIHDAATTVYTSITADHIRALIGKVLMNAEADGNYENLAFVCRPDVAQQIKKLDAVAGTSGTTYLLRDLDNKNRAFGFNMFTCPDAPTGSPGSSVVSYPIYFGFFPACCFAGVRGGLDIKTDGSVFFASNEIAVRSNYRVAINNVNVGSSSVYSAVGAIKITG
jgi:HK97 family phage major capsid protein